MQLNSMGPKASLRLTALDDGFGVRLRNALSELSGALQDAERSSGAFRRAMHLSHQIRGTAVSYGYQGVGDLVEIIDDTLARIDSGAVRPAFLWERARSSLRDATRLAELGPDVAPPQAKFRRTSVRTLLVIDDDEDFLRLMRGLGRRHSMHVITAPTVEQGLIAVEGVELSAVILDVHLLDECSFAAVDKIREGSGNKELPIIFASADGSLETRLSACAAGADRFLDKPLSQQRFSELLHQVPFCDPPATRIVILDDDEIVLEKYESELT